MTKPEKDCSSKSTSPEIALVNLSDKSLWHESLCGIEYSFYQTWGYCNAIRQSQNQDIELLKISDDTNGIIVIYSKRSKIPDYFDIYSPYGFGGIISWGNNFENIYQILFNWLKEHNVITAFLMAHPVFANAHDNHFEGHRSAFVIDMSRSKEKLWQDLGSGHKYEIKKNNKTANFFLTDDKQLIFANLPLLYKETISRVGA